MTKPRTVCVVTGSRAEFGLLRWVMHEIQKREALDLQLIVTGTHLVPAFGATVSEILDEGFTIDRRVEIVLNSDTPVGVAKSHGLAVAGIAEALESLRPDVVLLLGDRYEIHAAAVAALLHRIPIAHIHGGEVTTGSLDDQFRHSITKMAQGHFVAHEDYRRRVIQLGEDPATVMVVGGLGFESAQKSALMPCAEVEKRLGFRFQNRNVMLVFHPETSSTDFGVSVLDDLCEAIGDVTKCGVIISLPNADAGGGRLRGLLEQFILTHPCAVGVESMGQHLYLSTLALVDGIVGNSSSGLLEAPALGIPTLDVGSRQEGRVALPSVIRVAGNRNAIHEGLREILSTHHYSQAKQTSANLAQTPTARLICDGLESDLYSEWQPRRFVDHKFEMDGE